MTAKKSALRGDLVKVDASRIKRADYAGIPELGEAFFERADEHKGGGQLVKRGRGRPRGTTKASFNPG